MSARKIMLWLCVGVFMVGLLQAQSKGTIVLAYDPSIIDEATGEPPDMVAWGHLLEEQGYEVIPFYNASLSTASDATLDTLYNANLIIIGRRHASLALGDHKEAWNSIPTPILTQNLWGLRNNRLNWFDIGSVSGIPDEGVVYNAIIELPGDPVFDGIEITGPIPWAVGPFEYFAITDAGNGEVLARLEMDQSVLYVRFEPYMEFYNGSIDYPKGYRTVIGNGRDVSGGPPFNYNTFTEESQKVFLAEVARLVELGGGPVGAVKDEAARPRKCTLAQNYPNPFNPTTHIEFRLSKPGHTTLQVFDAKGQCIETLVDAYLDAGRHTVDFTATHLPTGIYYYRIHHEGLTDVRKMILVK